MRERVSQTEVVRSWLTRERRKSDLELDRSDDPSDWELVGTLFAHRPFQAAFVWRYPVTWYRTELDAATFRRLRVIEGPRDESWRKLSPDGTVLGAARRIRGRTSAGSTRTSMWTTCADSRRGRRRPSASSASDGRAPRVRRRREPLRDR